MWSIRKDICNGRGRLQLFRKFERTWSQGTAYETQSGFWIVSRPNSEQDVARTEKEARAMLLPQRLQEREDIEAQRSLADLEQARDAR
jgi:hypothetical protein